MDRNRILQSAAMSAVGLFLVAGSAYAAPVTGSPIQADADGSAATTAFGFTSDQTMGLWRGDDTVYGSSFQALHLAGGTDATVDVDGYLVGGTSDFAYENFREVVNCDAIGNAGFSELCVGSEGSYPHRLLLSNNGGTTSPVITQADTFTSSVAGVVPASGGGSTNFLRADGTWAAPSGGGGANTSLSNLSSVAINTALLGTDGSGTNPAYSFTNDSSMGLSRGPSDNDASIPSLHVAGGAGQTIDLEGYVELPTGELEADQSIAALSPGAGSFALTLNGPQAWTHCLDRNCTTDVVAPIVDPGQSDAYYDSTRNRLVLSNNGGAFSDVMTRSDLFSASVAGVVPASGGGTSNFLRADGTWASPATFGSHLVSTGPTASAGSSTCSSVTVTGTDTRGKISASCGSGQSVTVNFGSAYVSTPYCVIAPNNASAAKANAYINPTTTSFTMAVSNSTPSSTAGTWTYTCIQ